MKKYQILTGIAALMLASCSSEGVVNPADVTQDTNEAPISFNIDKKAFSRAASTKGLQAETYAFGVNAYKANDMTGIATAATGAATVMSNYLVGFWNGENAAWEGYKPTAGQTMPAGVTGGYWYYEGLGNDGNTPAAGTGYSWLTTTTKTEYVPTASTQYLKYWDLSNTYTYFFGYTPFNNAPTMGKDASGNVTMSWATLSGNTMYGFAKCKNEDFANTTSTVAMEFVPLMSQIRLAFYNAIPGYDVEIINYNTANDGVVAVPTTRSETTPYTYTAGGAYANSLTNAIVTFKDNLTTSVTGTTGTSTANILFDKDDFAKADGTATTKLGETYATRIYSNKVGVVPSTDNCGFTINVSLKLTAKDTKEVLYIYGARVFVPADYTTWEANKIYTYVFRITTTAPGSTTGSNPDVLPTPNNDQALYPIVFDQITIADITEGFTNQEWDINPGTEGAHNPSVHD